MTGAAAALFRRPGLDRSDAVALAVALGAAGVVGFATATGNLLPGLAAVGAVAVAALSRVAWLPFLVIVLVAGSFAEWSAFPELAGPGPDPRVSELLFAVAFCAWLIGGKAGRAFRPELRPASVAVLVLLAAVVGGVVVGVSAGADAQQALDAARPMLFYAAYFPATAAFDDARTRNLTLILGAVVTTAIVVLQVIQGFVGQSTLLFYVQDPLVEFLTCPDEQCTDVSSAGFPRVRPPGMPLVFVAAIFAAAYVLWGPRRRRVAALAVLAVAMVGVLVSLNRNMLVGIAFGLAVATLLTPNRARLGASLVGVCALAVAIIPFALSPENRPEQGTIAARAATLADVEQLGQSQTIKLRVREIEKASAKLRQSPLTGIGWGRSFGETYPALEHGVRVLRDQPFIHHQYLGVWLRAGLAGLLALLAALAIAGLGGYRALVRGPAPWLGAATLAAAAAVGVSSSVMILLMEPPGIVVFVALVALGAQLRTAEEAPA